MMSIYERGALRPLWAGMLALFLADSLDVVSSWTSSRLMPMWEEGNRLARVPLTNAFIPMAGIALKVEAYAVILPFIFLFYYALCAVFSRRTSALMASSPLWLLASGAAWAALGNISYLVFWIGWLHPFFTKFLHLSTL